MTAASGSTPTPESASTEDGTAEATYMDGTVPADADFESSQDPNESTSTALVDGNVVADERALDPNTPADDVETVAPGLARGAEETADT
jgi:hypothetical protein